MLGTPFDKTTSTLFANYSKVHSLGNEHYYMNLESSTALCFTYVARLISYVYRWLPSTESKGYTWPKGVLLMDKKIQRYLHCYESLWVCKVVE